MFLRRQRCIVIIIIYVYTRAHTHRYGVLLPYVYDFISLQISGRVLFFSFFFFLSPGKREKYDGANASIHQPDRSGASVARSRAHIFHGSAVNIALFGQRAPRSPISVRHKYL